MALLSPEDVMQKDNTAVRLPQLASPTRRLPMASLIKECLYSERQRLGRGEGARRPALDLRRSCVCLCWRGWPACSRVLQSMKEGYDNHSRQSGGLLCA